MNIVAELNQRHATAETVLEVMITSIAEVSGDKTEAEMLDEMRQRAQDDDAFARLQSQFEKDPDLVREAALIWLAAAAQDLEQQFALQGAVADADRSAPLLEVASLTLIALYGMYLRATRGIKKRTRKIELHPDGRYVETEELEYRAFPDGLKAAMNLFKAPASLASPEDEQD